MSATWIPPKLADEVLLKGKVAGQETDQGKFSSFGVASLGSANQRNRLFSIEDWKEKFEREADEPGRSHGWYFTAEAATGCPSVPQQGAAGGFD